MSVPKYNTGKNMSHSLCTSKAKVSQRDFIKINKPITYHSLVPVIGDWTKMNWASHLILRNSGLIIIFYVVNRDKNIIRWIWILLKYSQFEIPDTETPNSDWRHKVEKVTLKFRRK